MNNCTCPFSYFQKLNAVSFKINAYFISSDFDSFIHFPSLFDENSYRINWVYLRFDVIIFIKKHGYLDIFLSRCK